MSHPNTRTTYVRPLCESSGNVSYIAYPDKNANNANIEYSKNINDPDKENGQHLMAGLNSVHSSMFSKVEEIRKWQLSLELDCKQKDKKIEELTSNIENQRKEMVDLQLQNENLNIDLNEEIQKRTLVIEQLHSVKEFCSALKKHFNTLQGWREYHNKIEDAFHLADHRKMEELQELHQKFEELSLESSQKIMFLDNALNAESNKVLDIKEEFQQQISEFENEKETICNMLRNNQSELKMKADDLMEERNRNTVLVQEKNQLETKISQLANSNHENMKKVKETENILKAVEKDNVELESMLIAKKNEIEAWMTKYESCLETFQISRNELESNILTLKNNISNLEDGLHKEKINLKDIQCRNEQLIATIAELNNDKGRLEILNQQRIDDAEKFEILKENHDSLQRNMLDLLEKKQNLEICLNEEFSNCCSELQIKTQVLCQKEEEVAQLHVEYKALKDVKETENVTLKGNIDEMQIHLNELKIKLEDQSAVLHSKDEEIIHLTSALKENRSNIEHLKSENSVLKDELLSEKESTCLNCVELKSKLAELELAKNALKNKEDDLHNQKMETAEANRMLNLMEDNFNSSIVTRETENLKLKEEIESLKQEIRYSKDLDSEHKALQQDNASLQEELQSVISRSTKKEDEICHLKTTHKKLRKELKELTNKLQEAKKEIISAKKVPKQKQASTQTIEIKIRRNNSNQLNKSKKRRFLTDENVDTESETSFEEIVETNKNNNHAETKAVEKIESTDMKETSSSQKEKCKSTQKARKEIKSPKKVLKTKQVSVKSSGRKIIKNDNTLLNSSKKQEKFASDEQMDVESVTSTEETNENTSQVEMNDVEENERFSYTETSKTNSSQKDNMIVKGCKITNSVDTFASKSPMKVNLPQPIVSNRWDVDSVSSGSDIMQLVFEEGKIVGYTPKKQAQRSLNSPIRMTPVNLKDNPKNQNGDVFSTPQRTSTPSVNIVKRTPTFSYRSSENTNDKNKEVLETPQQQIFRTPSNIVKQTPSFSYRADTTTKAFEIKRKTGISGRKSPLDEASDTMKKSNDDIFSFYEDQKETKKSLWFQPKNFSQTSSVLAAKKRFFKEKEAGAKKPQPQGRYF